MKWFNNLRIQSKLFLLVGISFAILLALSVFTYSRFNLMGSLQDAGYSRDKDALLVTNAEYLDKHMYTVVADAEINMNFEDSKNQWNTVKVEALDEMSKVKKIVDTEEEKKCASEAEIALNDFITLYESKMLPYLEKNKKMDDNVRELDAQFDAIKERISAPLVKIADSIGKESEAGDTTFDVERRNSLNIFIAICIVGLALLLAISIVIINLIKKPIIKTVEVINEMALGHLDKRLNLGTSDEIGVMGKTLDQFAEDLKNNIVGTVAKLGEGDLSANVKAKDDRDEISPALNKTIQSIQGLVSEVVLLSKSAVDGNLSQRGKADNFKGAYKDIIDGVNKTLDSVIGPLNIAAGY
ncbi:MAG: HAMP domain-containing protein, partial [Bacillota bacterium]|nr:HAMP domain-containing protein [Bacillota bacterium]